MKKSKIKGKIIDLENQNKKYSFDKLMKLFDCSIDLCTDMISNSKFKDISSYSKSKHIFKEIPLELKEIKSMLNGSKVLMGICLLRNVYEEIIYIMSESTSDKFDLSIKTGAFAIRSIVVNNCDSLFNNKIDSSIFESIYSYLSKLVHLTNMKEIASYLLSNKNYKIINKNEDLKRYFVIEIKYYFLTIECIYLTFLNKKTNKDNLLVENFILLSNYLEYFNSVYFFAFSSKYDKKIERIFYNTKDKDYLEEQREETIKNLDEIKNNGSMCTKELKRISKIIDQQLINSGYNEMFMKELNS